MGCFGSLKSTIYGTLRVQNMKQYELIQQLYIKLESFANSLSHEKQSIMNLSNWNLDIFLLYEIIFFISFFPDELSHTVKKTRFSRASKVVQEPFFDRGGSTTHSLRNVQIYFNVSILGWVSRNRLSNSTVFDGPSHLFLHPWCYQELSGTPITSSGWT